MKSNAKKRQKQELKLIAEGFISQFVHDLVERICAPNEGFNSWLDKEVEKRRENDSLIAELGKARFALSEAVTHLDPIEKAIRGELAIAKGDDQAYWEHELKAFNSYSALIRGIVPPPSTILKCAVCNQDSYLNLAELRGQHCDPRIDANHAAQPCFIGTPTANSIAGIRLTSESPLAPGVAIGSNDGLETVDIYRPEPGLPYGKTGKPIETIRVKKGTI